MDGELKILHAKIDDCQVCASVVSGFVKPRGVDRSSGSRIMIVGEGPGNDELAQSIAFAGAAGRRLDTWLLGCGVDPEAVRKDCYLTSVMKCIDKNKEPSNQRAICAHLCLSVALFLHLPLAAVIGQCVFLHTNQ